MRAGYISTNGVIRKLAEAEAISTIITPDTIEDFTPDRANALMQLRYFADMFNLARRKIEDLQEEIAGLKERVQSQMCADCEQRNVDEAAGINYKAGEY